MFEFYFLLDEDICGFAGVPKNDTSMYVVIWLKEYFDLCDKSPNSDKTFVNVSEKSDVYDMYVAEMTAIHARSIMKEGDILEKGKFLRLWSVLFPNCVRRPNCDIPGKCPTCYEIDRIRREADSKMVKKMCKEAHALHRGGMFMKERMR